MQPLTCVILLINWAHFTHLAHQPPNKSQVLKKLQIFLHISKLQPQQTNKNYFTDARRNEQTKDLGYILAVRTRKFQGFWEEPFVKIPKSKRQCRRSVPPPLLYSPLSSLTPHWKITHDLTFSHVSRMSSTSSCFTPQKKTIDWAPKQHKTVVSVYSWVNHKIRVTVASPIFTSLSFRSSLRDAQLHWADELHISAAIGSKFANGPIADGEHVSLGNRKCPPLLNPQHADTHTRQSGWILGQQ